MSYCLDDLYHDLQYILFELNGLFPWIDNKYEKRLNRMLLFLWIKEILNNKLINSNKLQKDKLQKDKFPSSLILSNSNVNIVKENQDFNINDINKENKLLSTTNIYFELIILIQNILDYLDNKLLFNNIYNQLNIFLNNTNFDIIYKDIVNNLNIIIESNSQNFENIKLFNNIKNNIKDKYTHIKPILIFLIVNTILIINYNNDMNNNIMNNNKENIIELYNKYTNGMRIYFNLIPILTNKENVKGNFISNINSFKLCLEEFNKFHLKSENLNLIKFKLNLTSFDVVYISYKNHDLNHDLNYIIFEPNIKCSYFNNGGNNIKHLSHLYNKYLYFKGGSKHKNIINIKDNNKEYIKDKEYIENNNKEYIKDNNKEYIKDNNKEYIKDNNKEYIKDNNTKYIKDKKIIILSEYDNNKSIYSLLFPSFENTENNCTLVQLFLLDKK